MTRFTLLYLIFCFILVGDVQAQDNVTTSQKPPVYNSGINSSGIQPLSIPQLLQKSRPAFGSSSFRVPNLESITQSITMDDVLRSRALRDIQSANDFQKSLESLVRSEQSNDILERRDTFLRRFQDKPLTQTPKSIQPQQAARPIYRQKNTSNKIPLPSKVFNLAQ